MKRRAPKWLRVILWLFAGTAALLAIGYGIWHFSAVRDRDHQLALARAEGIPTTAEEFAKLMPARKPEENAAIEYKQVKFEGWDKHSGRVRRLVAEAQYGPLSPAELQEAKSILKGYESDLALMDRAVKKPYAWFDRNWSMGYATLFPDGSNVLRGVQCFQLRAAIAMSEGRTHEALVEAEKSLIVARHRTEEPTSIMSLIGLRYQALGVETLTMIALRQPGDPRAIQRMKAEINSMKEPPRATIAAEHLHSTLHLIRLSPEEFNSEFGFSADDAPPMVALTDKLPAPVRLRAEARVIEHFRTSWRLLGEEQTPANLAALNQASMEFNIAMLAFPRAANLIANLGGSLSDVDPRHGHRRKMGEFTVAFRVLNSRKNGEFPASLDLSDLATFFRGTTPKYQGFGTYAEVTVPRLPSEFDPDPKPQLIRIPKKLPVE